MFVALVGATVFAAVIALSRAAGRTTAATQPPPTASASPRALSAGSGVGVRLVFGSESVTVGAGVPDPVVGWSEMLVSRATGSRLGIVDDRYVLAKMSGRPTDSAFLHTIQPSLTPGVPIRVAK